MIEVISLAFLVLALFCAGVMVVCGVIESTRGPDPRLDYAASKALFGVSACMLAWWYVAAV